MSCTNNQGGIFRQHAASIYALSVRSFVLFVKKKGVLTVLTNIRSTKVLHHASSIMHQVSCIMHQVSCIMHHALQVVS